MRANWPLFGFGVALPFTGLTLTGVIHVVIGWAVAVLGAILAIVSLFLGKPRAKDDQITIAPDGPPFASSWADHDFGNGKPQRGAMPFF